jgi:hypothetical protein
VKVVVDQKARPGQMSNSTAAHCRLAEHSQCQAAITFDEYFQVNIIPARSLLQRYFHSPMAIFSTYRE